MINSLLCQQLDIKFPIFQGGMAWIANAGLASAVSNAGGLGIIAAMNYRAIQLAEEIKSLRRLTDKPFAVNIMLMSPYIEEIIQVVIEEKVPIVTTGGGNPTQYMKQLVENGVKVIPVVPSTALAKMVERSGAAAVIAEGGEAGGHVGELTTMCLVPLICDTVSIPVIAAGGIADGRGIAAAFMLGAEGVQLGTRFLTAHECEIHSNYKNRVLKAKDIDTIVTGKRLGHPIRSLKSPFTRDLFKKEYDSTISNEELEKLGEGALRLAVIEGSAEKGCFMAGQSAALIKKEQSVQEIIQEIFEEAEKCLRRANEWIK